MLMILSNFSLFSLFKSLSSFFSSHFLFIEKYFLKNSTILINLLISLSETTEVSNASFKNL